MKNVKLLIKNNLPKSWVKLLRNKLVTPKDPSTGYCSVQLTDDCIDQGDYKKYLGGGSESWESRGAFQLFFLQKMGLCSSSKVLDVGCGPGRASKHLIDFLENTGYHGVDYNPDFIKAANVMVEKNHLGEKEPAFDVVQDFNFEPIKSTFDYVIAFSVLNHCNVDQRDVFFRMLPNVLKENSKVYITHAPWFDRSYLDETKMNHTGRFGPDDFDIMKYGWESKNAIFPIIELTSI